MVLDSTGVIFQKQCVLLKACEKTGSTIEGSPSSPEKWENVHMMFPVSTVLPATKSVTNDQSNTWIITTGVSEETDNFSIYMVEWPNNFLGPGGMKVG